MQKRHILRLSDLSNSEISDIIQLAIQIKANPEKYYNALFRKSLLLLFEKTSTRTSVSFQGAIGGLGGYSILLDWEKSNFSISPVKYEIAYASRNCDAIMARVKHKEMLSEIAKASSVPVINGCDNAHHPTQALADYMTIYEKKGTFKDVKLCYVGVHNNVANSLVEGALALGVKLTLITPVINESSIDENIQAKMQSSENINVSENIEDIRNADFVYTDTWVDMEFFNDPNYAEQSKSRYETLLKWQINEELLGNSSAFIMHDMPIHPGFEIAEDVIESPQSIIYQQAENRMHAEKALLLTLLGSDTSI